MWHKIKELSSKNLSQRQIGLLLGIHRDTVRRYQRMSEKDFVVRESDLPPGRKKQAEWLSQVCNRITEGRSFSVQSSGA